MDQIKHYMEEALLHVSQEASVTEAAKLMQENKVGALLVQDGGKCIGIITAVDFCHKVLARELDPGKTKVEKILTRPLISLDMERTMLDAYQVMHQNNIRHVAVTENKKLVGILSIKDFANYYHQQMERETSA